MRTEVRNAAILQRLNLKPIKMNLQTVAEDIKKLEKALKLIEKTENYLHFKKSHLIFEMCEQINVLREKADRQQSFINSLN